MKFLRLLFFFLIIVSCRHQQYVASHNSNQPFPKAKRKNCQILPSFYSIDTMKTLKEYIECLSVRKLSYEHFCYTVITDVNVVDVRNGKIDKNMTVILHDHTIDSVFSSPGKLPEFPKGKCVRYVDGSGKYLAPGLCDMHTHYNCGLKNRFRFILSGTTSLRTMSNGPVMNSERTLVTNDMLVGPNLYTVGNADQLYPDSSLHANYPDPKSTWYYGGNQPPFEKDSMNMEKYIEQARKYQLSVSLEFFYQLPDYLFPLNSIFERRTAFRRLTTQENYNSFWFVFKYQHPKDWQSPDEQLEAPFIFAAIEKDDAHFCIGTESGQQENDSRFFSIADEMQTLCDSGVSTAAAIRMATLNAGELVYTTTNLGHQSAALGSKIYWYQRFGEVKENYRADLLLLSANPFDDIKNYSRIECTFLNGTCYTQSDLREMQIALTKW